MLKKGLVVVVTLLAVVLAAGAVYQWLAQRADADRFPPPGRMLIVDGLAMHLDCRGSGRPVVVMEAGLTTGSWSWGPVFDAVAARTEVCAYDRPGMGWSEPINRIADAAEVADRLHATLNAGGVEGPYVLLGMSAGGVYVREYYRRHPQGVVGMVLVDSSHEQQGDRLPPFEGQADLERTVAICSWLQPLGVIRATGAMEAVFAQVPGLDEAAKPLLMSRLNQSHYCASMLAESRSFNGEVYDAAGPESLGELPLVVLSQGNEPAGNAAFGLSDAEARAQRAAWDELQEELTALSSNGRRIIATRSGHMIQIEQPGIVIDAVAGLLDDLRGDPAGAADAWTRQKLTEDS